MKKSIGSNVLHMIVVQLSLEISGGLPQICKEDHRHCIPMDWTVGHFSWKNNLPKNGVLTSDKVNMPL